MKFIRRIYNLYFSKDKALTKRFYQLVKFVPSNVYIFKLAFSHRSKSPDPSRGPQNNERLEYLGDAVLGTIVAEYLFRKYPNENEGFLTKMRSKCVKRKSLNEIGYKMGLDEFIIHQNNKLSRSMLGNALEALVGAVYLEVGYRGTKKFVIKEILRKHLNIHELEHYDDNYKSQLLEHCQKRGLSIQYELIAKIKSDNRDRFKVGVKIDGNQMAVAEDFNKKSAEQAASKKALNKMKKEESN